MTNPTWRETAAPIIDRVIDANIHRPLQDIRRELRKAYPFGARANHPYKIWCSEVKRQLTQRGLLKGPEVNVEETPLFGERA